MLLVGFGPKVGAALEEVGVLRWRGGSPERDLIRAWERGKVWSRNVVLVGEVLRVGRSAKDWVDMGVGPLGCWAVQRRWLCAHLRTQPAHSLGRLGGATAAAIAAAHTRT